MYHRDGFNPLDSRPAGLCLDDGREIVGGKMQLVGIEEHGAFFIAMAVYGHKERIEYPFFPALRQLFYRITVEIDFHPFE